MKRSQVVGANKGNTFFLGGKTPRAFETSVKQCWRMLDGACIKIDPNLLLLRMML